MWYDDDEPVQGTELRPVVSLPMGDGGPYWSYGERWEEIGERREKRVVGRLSTRGVWRR